MIASIKNPKNGQRVGSASNESDYEDDCGEQWGQECHDDGGNSLGRDIMSRFFNDWDEDNSGTLDIEEVLTGAERCCDALNIDYDSRRISALFEQLDTDGNQYLDRKEFPFFLKSFAALSDIEMEDLAFVMAEFLVERNNGSENPPAKKSNGNSGFFKALFSFPTFRMGENKEASTHVERKPADIQPPLSSFLKVFSRKPYQKNDAVACDEIVVELSVDPPHKDESKDDDQLMMWDVSTD